MIFEVIRDHLVPEFTVHDCCRVLEVSRAGYYRWLGAPMGERQTRRAALTAASVWFCSRSTLARRSRKMERLFFSPSL